ncbi:MAG TPA: ribonuclease III [Candidatus Baltobacterales bacterium]|nr:ribonuclease III [Candidatus Baltobacterales bacterium]
MGIHPGEGRLIAQPQAAPLAQSLQLLQQKIGIHFRDPELLLEAVTHSSFANESPHLSPRDNERLEYLGDAVLQLITAEYLYKHHPGATEGELTQTRSAMVNTNTLALLAEQLELGSYLYLGKGIAKGGGRNLKSLLANAFEAVLGAMFLDAGYDAAYHYYLNRYRSLPTPAKDENFKGRLQQVAQERFSTTPFYDSEGARVGTKREYTSVVFAGAEPLGTGHGETKQEAEQDAARAALATLLGAAAEKPVAKTPKPRARRSPRKRVEADASGPAEPAVGEIVILAPEAEPAPEVGREPEPGPLPVPGEPADQAPADPPQPAETRSRQFGEPLE